MRGNLSQGAATAFDSNGEPSAFNQDNMDGVLIRVGSSSNPLGLAQFWAGSNINTTISHNLGRIPIGYRIERKSAACDMFDGTTTWTNTTISLQVTNGAADTIIYVF
jgi:hypothetical protein